MLFMNSSHETISFKKPHCKCDLREVCRKKAGLKLAS